MQYPLPAAVETEEVDSFASVHFARAWFIVHDDFPVKVFLEHCPESLVRLESASLSCLVSHLSTLLPRKQDFRVFSDWCEVA